MKTTPVLMIVSIVFLLASCQQTTPEPITDEIICNSPYIRHASGCCLDENSNSICDNDEVKSWPVSDAEYVGERFPLVPVEEPVNEWSLGSDSAKVKYVFFCGFEDSFCGEFYKETFIKIKKFIDTGDVKFVFKQLPLEFHRFSWESALASECAGEQGKFWEYHDSLFYTQGIHDERYLRALAERLNLNIEKFHNCVEDEKYREKIESDIREGVEAGVSWSPASVINGVVFLHESRADVGEYMYNLLRQRDERLTNDELSYAIDKRFTDGKPIARQYVDQPVIKQIEEELENTGFTLFD